MARIDDVAAAAGVSIKTVSRVLNGEPHVRAEMRDRVLSAVTRLGYRPNQSARRLAGGRSFIIASLYAHYLDAPPSYFASIQGAAARRCRDLGYHLVVEPFARSGEERFEVLDRLVGALRPDGIFVSPPLSDDTALLERIEATGVSVARIAGGRARDNINIDVAERDAGRMVADHLIGLGHTRIAIILPPAPHVAAMGRVEGFLAALEAVKLSVPAELRVPGLFIFDSGIAAADRLLSLAEPPTAIFATNDEMALGVMTAALDRGIAIPEQLSIVGFDETPASQTAWPRLTTVRQPLEEMGIAVIDALSQGATPRAPLQCELIVGATTSRVGSPAARQDRTHAKENKNA